MPDDRLPEGLRARIQASDCGCWIWTGRLNRNDYGRAYWCGLEPVAHRLVYELLVGAIPPALVLDHLCRRRACVNPQHLEPVTIRVNTLRGEAPLFSSQHHK